MPLTEKFEITTTREQLAKLADVLMSAFQEGKLLSNTTDTFTIELDHDPAIYVHSNGDQYQEYGD